MAELAEHKMGWSEEVKYPEAASVNEIRLIRLAALDNALKRMKERQTCR